MPDDDQEPDPVALVEDVRDRLDDADAKQRRLDGYREGVQRGKVRAYTDVLGLIEEHLGVTSAPGQRAPDPPELKDFFEDMNEHAGADYKTGGEGIVLELDTLPGGNWRLVVWEAVQDAEGYVPPDGKPGNRYAWDAIGSTTFEDRDEAVEKFSALRGDEESVREFAKANPYDGPRSPHSERAGENR